MLNHALKETLPPDGVSKRQFRIAGHGAIRVSMGLGDVLRLASLDGCQSCEMLVLDEKGQLCPDVFPELSVAGNNPLLEQMSATGSEGERLRTQFKRWGISSSLCHQALHLEGPEFPILTAGQACTLILIAAGQAMHVASNEPTTELIIVHQGCADDGFALPEPLAEPAREIRVPDSSARVYEVKAGEWIQIIDVEGKQCSDFIAFDKAVLDQGAELTLDSAATRTLMGQSLPRPGLYSRFADQHLQTMLEVVQDTVGRHDSFLLACSPRYYEDRGYFGHPSCTENFNRALAEYGISPRQSWPAINFFFNTTAEACGGMSFDEPWSHPGDYVLLRATRDLLCVSSACPDDIDTANGWKPTDIHIRIYGSENEFSRSVAYRTTPEELPRKTQNTAFHSRTSALTQQFTEYRGYWVPSEFEGWGARAEYLACRERVAVMDLSPLRKFEVLGPDAEALMQFALTRNVRRVAVGEIVYSAMCHETGGMVDDGTLFRMGEQGFRWICGDPYSGQWLRALAERDGFKATVRNSSDQIHNLALQGPRSRELLSELIWTPETQPSLGNLKWFHFLIGRLGGPTGKPVMVSRTGYTGELGFEVWCHPDDAETLWDAIWRQGQKYDIAPLGFDALDMLRIEAGLIFAHHEFCPQTNPYEAGIGFTVPMKTKEDAFMGREAMARQPAESRHKLMGLLLDANDPVVHGDTIYNGRFPVGVVTSATQSPLLRQQIALCRVAPDFAVPGTQLEVGKLDGLQKRLSGELTSLPFYDPDRTRVRS